LCGSLTATFNPNLGQISELKGIFRDTLDTNQNDESVADAIYDIPVTALTGASLGIIAFVEIGLVTLSWFVYKEMGWQIYHGEQSFQNHVETFWVTYA
jgi:hypothetical protein